MGSKRLPGKVLLLLHGMPLIEHVWQRTVEAFGKEHTIVAHPDTEGNAPLVEVLESLGAQRFAWDGPEDDVLSRFYFCAHTYRWMAESIIVRVTADDWRKDAAMMRRVANGERLPVEQGAEAFTLAMLDEAQRSVGMRFGSSEPYYREHLTETLFPVPPPAAPPGIWSIDTEQDLAAARGAMPP